MGLFVKSVLLFGIIALTCNEVLGAKILSISIMSSKSHKNVYEPLLQQLARRGHQITIVTPVAASKPFPNITEVIGIPYHDMMDKSMFDVFKMKMNKEQMNPFTHTIPMFQKFGPQFFKLPQIQEVLKQDFDLVFMSAFMNECIFGVIPHFKAPYILISPIAAPGYLTSTAVGNPSPMSFSPLVFFGYTDEMTFFQRVKNVLANIALSGVVKFYYEPKMEVIYRDHFGQDSLSVEEIQKNVSMIFGNGHFTLNFARPLMPSVVDVGGMHCRPAEKLPKDIDDFLSGSGDDGFILFSLGSIVQGNEMPERIRQVFVNTFAKLKQRVIWKWETEQMEDIPKNVKLGKWLPQQDILGHPKIRMFITHGGLLSTEEAIYHGVPLIGFPFFGDQDWNMNQAETLGFAIPKDITDITEESLLEAINRILNEPSYTQKAKELSASFRDRPQKPLDLAVYWTEYVLRHKGAPQLRSAGRLLNTFQYHSLDVLAFVLTVLFSFLYTIYAIIRWVCRKMCGKSNKTATKPRAKRD